MSNTFRAFDHPYTLTKYVVTEGYHNSSGVWVPPSDASDTFNGHIGVLTEKELQFLPDSVKETGGMKLAVEASVSIKNGDKIKITDSSGSTTMWYVGKELGSTNMMKRMGSHRRFFYISLTKNV